MFDHFTVSGGAFRMDNVSKDESTPIVLVIPGLTSDSSSAVSYILFLFICLPKCWFYLPIIFFRT